MVDPKISSVTNSHNTAFLQEQTENKIAIIEQTAVEQEPLKEETLFSSIDAFSLSLEDLIPKENSPNEEKEISEDSHSSLPLLPFSLEDLIHPEGSESSFPEEAKMPLLVRLLAQVNAIIPLLKDLEQGQKLTQRQELQLMRTLTTDEIGNIYFSGLTGFGGNTLAAFASIFGGKAVGEAISGLTQGVSSLADAGRTRAQKGYQEEQNHYQEAKDVLQGAERLRDQLLTAIGKIEDLGHLRV